MFAKDLIPGDIISEYRYDYNDLSGIYKFEQEGVDIFVRNCQHIIFGDMSDYRPVHTVVYLGDGKYFSVEPPKPVIKNINDYMQNRSMALTVYRCRYYLGMDIKTPLMEIVNKILGYDKPYDVGDLADDLISFLLGTPYKEVRLFDYGHESFVCSEGVALCFEYIRKKMMELFPKTCFPRLFTAIDESKWSKSFVKKYKENGSRWSLKNTYPANFANTFMFDNELNNLGKLETEV